MVEDLVAAALASLTGPAHSRESAADLVPRSPGLYAFHGDDTAWSALGLVQAFDGQPLYVGKAERSLNGRDVGTHFAAGKTGSSTLRRSIAALLRDELGLVPVPRNTARPDGTASFGLDASGEARLSTWMDKRLALSIWTSSEGVPLGEVEAGVIRGLRPPLNLSQVGEPRARLREARKRMADAARGRRPEEIAESAGFDPPVAPQLSGEESFDGLDASVADFWRFAMSDLRINNVRGYLAEYLVARAVGAAGPRVEWDAWDVTTPDGIRIEVKSAGYLQAWAQKKLSVPTFRVAAAYSWDATSNTRSVEQSFNADVYVFCCHTAKAHEEYDPLAVSQWQFHVAGRAVVEAQAGAYMGLTTLQQIAGDPVPYSLLRAAVDAAAPVRG